MDREQVEKFRKDARIAATTIKGQKTLWPTSEFTVDVYERELIRLARNAALDEAKEACEHLSTRSGDAQDCADAIDELKEPQS